MQPSSQSTIRELNLDEVEKVSGGLYFELGEFRFASGSYGMIATWGGGHTNGGWTVGHDSNGFYVNQ